MLNESEIVEPRELYRVSMSDKGLRIIIKNFTYHSQIASLDSKILYGIEFYRFNDEVNLIVPFPFITGTGNGGAKNTIDWQKINTCTYILSRLFEKLNKSFIEATPNMYLSHNPQSMIIEIELDNKGNEIKVFLNSEVCNLLKANYFGIIRLSEIEKTILRTYLKLTTTSQRAVNRTLISFKQNHGSKSVVAMINDSVPYFSAPAKSGSSVVGKLNSDEFDRSLGSRDIESGVQILTLLSALASFWENTLNDLEKTWFQNHFYLQNSAIFALFY